MSKFKQFALNKQIIKALDYAKFIEPTTIQNKIIPLVNQKQDVLGVAQTGTGKTAAYVLPILHNITIDKSEYKKKCFYNKRRIINFVNGRYCARGRQFSTYLKKHKQFL